MAVLTAWGIDDTTGRFIRATTNNLNPLYHPSEFAEGSITTLSTTSVTAITGASISLTAGLWHIFVSGTAGLEIPAALITTAEIDFQLFEAGVSIKNSSVRWEHPVAGGDNSSMDIPCMIYVTVQPGTTKTYDVRAQRSASADVTSTAVADILAIRGN